MINKPEQQALYRSHNQTQPIKVNMLTGNEIAGGLVGLALLVSVAIAQHFITKTNEEYKPIDRTYQTNSYEVRK